MSPTQRSSVGASPNTLTEKKAADSPQPATVSCELATHEDTAQPAELRPTMIAPTRSNTPVAVTPRLDRQRFDLNNHFSRELVWIARYAVLVRVNITNSNTEVLFTTSFQVRLQGNLYKKQSVSATQFAENIPVKFLCITVSRV